MQFISWFEAKSRWSIWVAGFWGAVGAAIIILSALLYEDGVNFWTGGLLILASVSMGIARFLRQPGTEE